MAKKYVVILAAAFLASFVNPFSSLAETIRSRAESHFSSLGWTDDPSLAAPVERKAVAIPGGDETFPAMTPTGDTGLVSVYPELEGLGKLDYSALDANLFSVLARASDGFRNRELPASLCDPSRSFLAPVNTFRLKKLPEVQGVRFARPVADAAPSVASGAPQEAAMTAAAGVATAAAAAVPVATENAPANQPANAVPAPASVTCRFRLMCASPADGKPVPLFLTVHASQQGGSWFISDITFDGKTYAELAVQN